MIKYPIVFFTTFFLSHSAMSACQWLDSESNLHNKEDTFSNAIQRHNQQYPDWPIVFLDFYYTDPTRFEIPIRGQHQDGRTIEHNYAYQEISCDDINEEKSYGQPMCPDNGTNPINTATGNKYQREVDFMSNGEMPLMFVRHYNSKLTSNNNHIGKNWRHHYDRSVELVTETTPYGPAIETEVRLSRPDGKVYSFYPNSTSWISDPDVRYKIEKLSNGWEVTSPDNQTETYDTSGRLISIESLSGHTHTLLYNQSDRLYQINDSFNRSIIITYDSNDRIHTITTPNSEVYTYQYDTDENLSEVTYPNVSPGINKQYHYTDSRYPNALTAITDQNGEQYAVWTYDENEKAISSEHAGSAERVTITYNPDGSATLTDSLGAVRDYAYSIQHGVARTSSVNGGLCNSCSGDTNTYIYDSNGFLSSTTDWEGNQTTYTFNTRGLQEERIEAVGTPQERKTTTEWHATYRIPTKVEVFDNTNTLLQRTTYSYDSQGRRLSQTTESL